jgi:predicted HTH transcriptional regulator
MNEDDFKHLIEELTSLKEETEWVEFKVNNSNVEEIGGYISALSNSACLLYKDYGYLVFGIVDKTHKIVGTSFKPKSAKKGGQPLEHWLSSNLDPKINFEIIEMEYEGKFISLFKIESAKFRPNRFKDVAYIRINSCKTKLSNHPEKERKIWEITSKISFEELVAFEKIDEDKIFELLDYSSYFDLMNIKLPDNRKGIIEKFIEEKFLKKNHSKYDVTNLGAILFAKNLLKFPRLKRKAVRIIFYDGVNKLKSIKEYSTNKGYAIEFGKIIDYLIEQLPTNEIIEKAFRKKIQMYPEIALRELMANSIIHQDFSEIGSSPLVEVYSDRVEFINPGRPLIETNRFIDHSPKSRNEILAGFMRRINVCEERGSGVDRVINAVEVYQLPAPNFIAEEHFMRVVLYSPKDLEKMDKDDKIRACYQHCCLKYVSNELMSNETLRERFKIKASNYPSASRIIKYTIDSGLIKKAKGNNYVPFWVK